MSKVALAIWLPASMAYLLAASETFLAYCFSNVGAVFLAGQSPDGYRLPGERPAAGGQARGVGGEVLHARPVAAEGAREGARGWRAVLRLGEGARYNALGRAISDLYLQHEAEPTWDARVFDLYFICLRRKHKSTSDVRGSNMIV